MIFRKAILIIHGFAGGTYDEEELAFNLELNKSFDVFNDSLFGEEQVVREEKVYKPRGYDIFSDDLFNEVKVAPKVEN